MHVGADMEDGGEPIVVRLPITVQGLARRLGRKPIDIIRPAFEDHGLLLTPHRSLTAERIVWIGRLLGVSIEVEGEGDLADLRKALRASEPLRTRKRRRRMGDRPGEAPDPGPHTVRLPVTLEELAAQMRCKPAVLIKVAFQDYGMMLTPNTSLEAKQIKLIARGLCAQVAIENADDAEP